ncbi:SipW-dependent-type signal peptide-containing protein [Microbacterium sp. P07]|uniref:SipW-dependent-type signal peptide-containing protein n=1 Tax=Microbacterium sp. P07 TaxID=3366952 RepID=UPI0037472662
MQEKRRATRRKIFAIAAGGAVLGLGVSATLAAWTDTEWVFGGNGTGGPGIGTSTFEIQQNSVPPFAAGTWTDEEENPGGEITFSPGALALSPGDEVYAPVALRSTPSSIAGEVALQPAVAAAGVAVTDPDDLLLAALAVRVATDDAPFTCDDTAFAGAPGGPAVIADGPLLTAGGTAEQEILAVAGSTQYYCFAITLPDPFAPATGDVEDYMGLTAAPAWQFAATS